MTLRLNLALAFALASSLFASSTHAQTLDRVRRQSGLDSGEVTSVTALGVTLTRGGVETNIPAEDIRSIQWGGEPAALGAARNAIDAGRYDDAAKMLAEVSAPASARAEIEADVDFYKALAAVRSAILSAGDAAAATREMDAFLKAHAGSFHAAAAIEALGDAQTAAGDYESARTTYAKLAKAKSPYLDMRSAWLAGRAWQAEGKHSQALESFAAALASKATGTQVEPLRLSIEFDQAVSLAATGKIDDAAKELAAIINAAEPENGELLARAYNALGKAYLAADDSQAALFAFLHVDLLYSNQNEAHAESLHYLVALWRTAGRDARSQATAEELAKRYPQRRWAAGK